MKSILNPTYPNALTFTVHSDYSHGWMKMSVEDAVQLLSIDILAQVSKCSYISSKQKAFFFEEDDDMPLICSFLRSKGYTVAFNEVDDGRESGIRSMPSFNPNILKSEGTSYVISL